MLAGPPNESELRVSLVSGSTIRLYGADNPDRLRGLGFDGAIIDEYADMRPSLWAEVIRPTLADRKGWAVFIGTPKGRVGLYDIFHGKGEWKNMEFFRLMLKASETGIIDSGELLDLRAGLTEDAYSQEMECSFEAAIKGSVYGKLMAQARKDGRVCSVPYDPSVLVHTSWDLAIGDPTAIWFVQNVGRETRLIDYYESSGTDVAHYAGVLKQKPYTYGSHILPHDAEPKEFTSGKSVKEVLQDLGIRPLEVQPVARVEDGINAARLRIPMCWFDEAKCARGIEALEQYRYEFDEKLGTLKAKPLHDWASHAADAFRYMAEGFARGVGIKKFNRKINYPELGII